MLQLKPLDQNVPIFQQINTDVSPVVLVNVFQVAAEEIPALLKAWEADANWMKQQPGYISTQLHQGIARKHGIHELRVVGVRGPFSGGVQPSRVQAGAWALSFQCRGVPSSLHAAHGTQSMRRSVAQRPDNSYMRLAIEETSTQKPWP